jgi:hypothetical protein
VDVYYKLNEKSRLYFSYSATKLDDRQSFADGSLAGYFDSYTLPRLGRRQRQANCQRGHVGRSFKFITCHLFTPHCFRVESECRPFKQTLDR